MLPVVMKIHRNVIYYYIALNSTNPFNSFPGIVLGLVNRIGENLSITHTTGEIVCFGGIHRDQAKAGAPACHKQRPPFELSDLDATKL